MMRAYRPDVLVRLCRTLLPDDPSLAEELALASRDPSAYYSRFRQRLQNERGIEPNQSDFPDLPWVAMLDGLRYREHLAEIDWRAPAELVMEEVDKLLHDPGTAALRWDWVDAEYADSISIAELLHAIGRRLFTQSQMFAQVYEVSDTLPTMIINPDRLPELQRLARLSGYGDIQPLDSRLTGDFHLPWLTDKPGAP